MAPIAYSRFNGDEKSLFEASTKVLKKLGFKILDQKPETGFIHAHGVWRGTLAHLEVSVDRARGRGVMVRVLPGDEGKYLDLARKFMDELSKQLR